MIITQNKARVAGRPRTSSPTRYTFAERTLARFSRSWLLANNAGQRGQDCASCCQAMRAAFGASAASACGHPVKLTMPSS